jgi:hypothetical protein
MRLPHTVTRLRAPLVEDRRGEERPDWPNAVASDPFAAWVQQRSAEERLEPARREQRTTWLLVTRNPDLVATDRIVWAGDTYEIDGEPNVLETSRGFHHLEASLLRVTG